MPTTAKYHLYITTNKYRGTLYVGITNNLPRRILEHKSGYGGKFSYTYNCKLLVYFEPYDCYKVLQRREQVIKRWRRNWKLELIEKHNPDWRDLCEEILPKNWEEIKLRKFIRKEY